jgi:hypothetical protein
MVVTHVVIQATLSVRIRVSSVVCVPMSRIVVVIVVVVVVVVVVVGS